MKTAVNETVYVIFLSVSMKHVQNNIKGATTALKGRDSIPSLGFLGRETAAETGLSQSTTVFTYQTIPPLLRTHISLTYHR